MAKRKVDAENRGFQARWEAEYMFTEVKGKPVCLLCGESLAADADRELEPLSQLPDHEREALYRRVPECTVCR